MTERDYLWCLLNLMLDDEEELDRLCPRCREEAERERCPVCGRETGMTVGGRNAAFDMERFMRLGGGNEVD